MKCGYFDVARTGRARTDAAGCLDNEGARDAFQSDFVLLRVYENKVQPDPGRYAEAGVIFANAYRRPDQRIALVGGNEPNSGFEGWNTDPAGYLEWFVDWAAAVTGLDPTLEAWWAGMSPGYGPQAWYQACGVADGAVLHAYGLSVDELMLTPRAFVHLHPDVPWLVGEANHGVGAGRRVDRDLWAATVLQPTLAECHRLGAQAYLYFVYDGWTQDDATVGQGTPAAAKDTRIDAALRAWTDPEAIHDANPDGGDVGDTDPAVVPGIENPPRPTSPSERKPMTENPWRGKILTVWDLPPDPADLVADGHLLAVDGFEVKTADGNSSWLGRRHVTREYVDALKDAGFRVLGWSYNYCDGLRDAGDRGDGIPEEEAAAALRGVVELGLEAHTFDLEIECEGHADLVEILLDEARNLLPHGTPVGAHVWADLAGHADYPAAEILGRVDVLRPMIYRPVWNAARCWESWGALFAGDPPVVCPVWGITEGEEPDLAEDMAFADERAIPGEAYWEHAAVAGLSAGVRALIAERTFADDPAAPDAITSALDGIWSETERLAALEHADRAVAIQTHVQRLKVALGRES